MAKALYFQLEGRASRVRLCVVDEKTSRLEAGNFQLPVRRAADLPILVFIFVPILVDLPLFVAILVAIFVDSLTSFFIPIMIKIRQGSEC